ncbi:LysR family transcriptional regulator [Vibrio inusitatus NBRC 102082]|uniref:LysR family transcriptional regulator n=1 Tax=Vibrio inusitatus NBRC 102082 TaxID=1219070 RepID=A0A4Y3HYK5_9VIBR|nr:LysR substrate-binding domain-containing protein [Vibrio inusitatus]GEA52259.1 LysR family transcriptional regulator [Vibrio inusitatus NBRC 102082]
MDLNLLKTFDAVMKSKSVNEAAEVLNITAPAVSHALNRLRDQYQDPLFIRQGRGIVPTSFAVELHSEIQEPLSFLLNGSKSRQDFVPSKSQRTFRISSHKDIDVILVPAITRYKKEVAPHVVIQADVEHLNETDRQDDLRRRRVDIILATVPLSDKGYHNELLFELEGVVVASKDHPSIQQSLTFDDYMQAQHVTWKTQRLSTNTLDSVAMEGQLPTRMIAYSTGSLLTGMHLISETDWLGVCGKWHADKLASKMNLNVFPLPFEAKKVPIYMTWHQSQKRDKGHEWLREFIKKLAQDIEC